MNTPKFDRRGRGRRAVRLLRLPEQEVAPSGEPATLEDIVITHKLKSRRRRNRIFSRRTPRCNRWRG